MSSALILFGIIATALTPTIAIVVTRYYDRREREEKEIADRAERAEVAQKVEAVAVKAEAVEGQVGEVATNVDEFRSETYAKLIEIHGLVDGQLTAALMSEMAALKDRRATMIELKELKESGGLKPTKDALEAIAQADARIAELAVQIAARVTEQTAVDAKARAAAEQGKVPLSQRLPKEPPSSRGG